MWLHRCQYFRCGTNLFNFSSVRTHSLTRFQAVWSKRFCIGQLAPGTTYTLCAAPSTRLAKWTCEMWTTPLADSQTSVPTATNHFRLALHVEGTTDSWIQISWPPPAIRLPATPPIGYVVGVKNEACWEQIVLLTAPWVSWPLNKGQLNVQRTYRLFYVYFLRQPN